MTPQLLKIWKVLQVVLYILGGFIVVFIIVKIKNFFFPPAAKEVNGTIEYNQEQKQVQIVDDITKQVNGGIKRTYALSAYKTLADSLHLKFGVFVKAKYADVYPIIIQCKNYVDILELKKAYGIREIAQITPTKLIKDTDLDQAFEMFSEYKASAFWRAFQSSIGSNKQLAKAQT